MVIDMEGFFLSLTSSVENWVLQTSMEDLPTTCTRPLMKYTELDSKQIRQVQYVRRRIHGLQFTPIHVLRDAKSQEFLKIDVQTFVQHLQVGEERFGCLQRRSHRKRLC